MIVGIDFDNTIVCYDDLFYREALERELIPEHVLPNKQSVRDYLRSIGQEDKWTELQAYVYGPGIMKANAYTGVLEFFDACRVSSVKAYVISHKTQFPYAGGKFDLRECALAWLKSNGFFEYEKSGIGNSDVFFLDTKKAKMLEIERRGCGVFIDDLPEFLTEQDFPSVKKILFDPHGKNGSDERFSVMHSWSQAFELMFGDENT
ncbi:MAG TPA: hypothetical protein V6C86_02880 [Oculatellaceae cyanobacterium]